MNSRDIVPSSRFTGSLAESRVAIPPRSGTLWLVTGSQRLTPFRSGDLCLMHFQVLGRILLQYTLRRNFVLQFLNSAPEFSATPFYFAGLDEGKNYSAGERAEFMDLLRLLRVLNGAARVWKLDHI